jgi:hypothetical protein
VVPEQVRVRRPARANDVDGHLRVGARLHELATLWPSGRTDDMYVVTVTLSKRPIPTAVLVDNGAMVDPQYSKRRQRFRLMLGSCS